MQMLRRRLQIPVQSDPCAATPTRARLQFCLSRFCPSHLGLPWPPNGLRHEYRRPLNAQREKSLKNVSKTVYHSASGLTNSPKIPPPGRFVSICETCPGTLAAPEWRNILKTCSSCVILAGIERSIVPEAATMPSGQWPAPRSAAEARYRLWLEPIIAKCANW